MLRFLLIGLFFTALLAIAKTPNYADQLLDQLAQQVAAADSSTTPLDRLLLAEEIYYLSHESGRQTEIANLLETLYRGAQHQELKAETAFLLIQQSRQLGDYDRVSEIVRSLGFPAEWKILGPLAPDMTLNTKTYLNAQTVRGLARDVSWRSLRAYGQTDFWAEGMGQYGYFGANHAIYPNQLAGALFTTCFYLAEPAEVRLGLGWAYRIKAWVNRTQVFEGQEHQGTHPDQAVIGVNLKKGWHRLTLYLESESEDPNLGFYARLTDRQGNALQCTADPGKRVGTKKAETVEWGEIPLAAMAQERSDYALASVLTLKEQVRHSPYGSAKTLMERAFATNPTWAAAQKLITLSGDDNEDWKFLTAYLKQLPAEKSLERAWCYSQLGQIALGQDRYWEARHYTESALDAYPNYWPAAILLNNTYAALDLNGEALRRTLALNDAYPGVPWIMMDLCDLYWSMTFTTRSEELTDAILDIRHGSHKFGERKIKILKDRGDEAALDVFYNRLLKDGPYGVSAVLSYNQFLTGNHRLDKAEALLARYLRQLPENPYLLEAMGQVKLTQGSPDALAYLQQALNLRPQNPDLEKLIALNQNGEPLFYKPYMLAEAPDTEPSENSPIIVNFENTVRKVAPNGLSTFYQQIEFEVATEQGAKELTGHSFSYAPLRQKAELLKAEFYRGGQTFLLTKYGRSRISDPQYRMYYDLVSFQIAFPTLQVGDRVRIEYRIDDTDSTNIFGDYFGDLQYFAQSYPARRIKYTLILPKSREVYYHVEKMAPEFREKIEGDNRVLSWTLDEVASFETESGMPGLAGYLPYVAISTFNDWQAMATWYAALIKNQLILDQDTKNIVAELTEGVTDHLEIVKRIHGYVVTNTRYVALEFGIHGYKPYDVNLVSTRQFGDCKDKASLMVAMLREAGVDADIAIVRTADEGDVHTYPAMLSYFNHAIAYIPEFDLFLDGTAEFSGINELPEMDQGALTLLVDKSGKGRLTRIPVSGDNREGLALDLEARSDGVTRVQGELFYQGVNTPGMRQYLSINAKLDQNLQALLADMVPGLSVQQAGREGSRLNESIRLKFEGTTDRLLQSNGQEIKLPLTILSSRLTERYAPNASRKFPLEFGSPKSRSVKLSVHAPSGYQLVRVPEPLDLENDDFKVSINFNQQSDSGCIIDYQIAFKSSRVKPDDYRNLRELLQAHDRILDQVIYFTAP